MQHSDDAKRFIDLARRGNGPGASHGEQAANRLLNAMCDDISLLDERALDGFRELASLLHLMPWVAAEVIHFVEH